MRGSPTMVAMPKHTGAMHVAKVSKKYATRAGVTRESVSYLLRRTYRDGGKVKHETLANLSALPQAALEAVRASLAGNWLVPADHAATVTRSLPHGHVAAVHAQARALGLPGLLGPAGRRRDLALALIVARVVRPGSKLATTSWWVDTTLAADLDVAAASTDEVYAAMDWLVERQDTIEVGLAARHLAPKVNPARMAMFDLSSSWVEGSSCPLAARGYSRDGKKGKPQIEYGLLTDPEGRPVAVRVFAGNTADPAAFIDAVEMVRDKFKLTDLVMVGDRGMITAARTDGPLQLSLFDQADLAEISHPDYPGERLIACRNPLLAAERARKRAELLAATEQLLAPLTQAVTAGRLAQIDAEAALDGIYVLRTSVPADTLDPAGVVTTYKNLARVERDFRSLKTDDLDLRPIYHRLEDRVKAHVLICMLAAYLTWHLRRAWAPLTYTDETPPDRHNPVTPATRSAPATRKASRHQDTHHQPVRSFRGLLDHLAALTRNNLRYGTDDTAPIVPTLAVPTPPQRRAFDLLDQPIPLTLK